jgi:hypothetical protein
MLHIVDEEHPFVFYDYPCRHLSHGFHYAAGRGRKANDLGRAGREIPQ